MYIEEREKYEAQAKEWTEKYAKEDVETEDEKLVTMYFRTYF